MICILSTSGIEKAISSCGAETSKAMLVIGEQPLCSSILNELQSLEEFFEKILIVGSDLKDFEDWAKFGMHDEFFKTKLTFLRNADAKSMDDDVWGAYEWLTTQEGRPQVLAIRADIYALDFGRLVDGDLGSFRAYADGSPLDIWRMDDFVESVNTMVELNEEGQWSLEAFTNAMMQKGKMEALDMTGAVLSLKTRKDYFKVLKMQLAQKSDSPFAYEVDEERQTIRISNAWKSKRWSPSVWKTERMVQSGLWDCWDYLESASPSQRPYLPAPIDRGPDVRGEYCNWIELQMLPDASLESMMISRKLDESSWREMLDKVLDILEEEFWTEKEPDWRSDADRKDRQRYLDMLSDKWMDLVRAKVPTFSMIKWDTLVKRHLEWMESHVKDRKSLFHNGTGGRLAHGNLSLKTILCNWQTLDIHFIEPTARTGILVDSFAEYVGLYAGCWCLLPVFIRGRHVDCGADGLDVPDYIAENAYAIESILDSRLGEKAVQAKIEALMQSLELFELVPAEHQKAFMAFLQYRANELYIGSVNSRAKVDRHEPCIGEMENYARCPKLKKLQMCLKEMKDHRIHDRMHRDDCRPMCPPKPRP